MIYAFAEYELDTSLLELRRNGQRCPMEPQVFDVLAHLVEHRDRVVRRQELLDHVWPEGFVSDSALSSRIMAARKAIGDSGETQQLIRTVHRRGFRFVGQVAERSILALNAFPGIETASPGAAPVYDSGAKQAPIPAGPLVVGRNAELAKLRTWVTEAFSGHPRTVLVSADAGLGKTTLLDLLLRDLTENSEALIGRGQCIEQHGIGEPYMPVLEALDEICRGPRGRGRVAMLARHAPTWLAQLPWLLDDTEMEPLRERLVGTTRERMLREMAEALRVIGERTPLLLVLEDLHWSDPSTVDLISFLARGARSARVALLGTYRPSGVGSFGHPLLPTVREMRARGLCEEITLNPLSEPEVRMLAAARLGTPEADPEVGRLLHRRTGGNPLFVVNVLEHWLGQELVSSEGPTRPIEDLARTVPGDLRGMIEEQFRQFAREDRSLLEACAVAGREFSAAAVAAAVGTALDQTEARCEALSQRREFLTRVNSDEWPDGTISARYAFTHDLYAEVLYEMIPDGTRAGLHRAIGTRLEAAYHEHRPSRAAEVAEHFVRGRDHARAAQHLRLAAQEAVQRSAYHEAVLHATAALDHVRYIVDARERTHQELLLQAMMGPAVIATRGWADPAAEIAFSRARSLGHDLDDRPVLSSVLYGLATLHEVRGEFDNTQRVLAERGSILAGGEAVPLVDSCELMACSTFHQGRFDEALGHASQGLRLYDPSAHVALSAFLGENPGVSCHNWCALSSWFLGFPDRAQREVQAALALAEDEAHWFSLAHAQEQAACLHQLRGELAEAQRRAEAVILLGERQGFPYRVATGSILRGWALAGQGRPAEGIPMLLEGLRLCRDAGARLDYPYFLALLAEARLSAGDADAAVQALEEALSIVEPGRGFFYEAELHRLLGLAFDQPGRAEAVTRARAAFHRALDVAAGQQARSLELRAATSLARLALAAGRPDEALEVLGPVYTRFSEGFATRDLIEADHVLERLGMPPAKTRGGRIRSRP